MLGALCHYVTHAGPQRLPTDESQLRHSANRYFRAKSGKRERGQLYADRALKDLELTLSGNAPAVISTVYANQ